MKNTLFSRGCIARLLSIKLAQVVSCHGCSSTLRVCDSDGELYQVSTLSAPSCSQANSADLRTMTLATPTAGSVACVPSENMGNGTPNLSNEREGSLFPTSEAAAPIDPGKPASTENTEVSTAITHMP